MKKILTLLIAWFAMSSVCMAQNGPFTLGYCDGQLATVATGDLFSNEKHIWVQSAVYIPAEQAKVLAGNRIESTLVLLTKPMSTRCVCGFAPALMARTW